MIGLATPTIEPLTGLNVGGWNSGGPVNGVASCPAAGPAGGIAAGIAIGSGGGGGISHGGGAGRVGRCGDVRIARRIRIRGGGPRAQHHAHRERDEQSCPHSHELAAVTSVTSNVCRLAAIPINAIPTKLADAVSIIATLRS